MNNDPRTKLNAEILWFYGQQQKSRDMFWIHRRSSKWSSNTSRNAMLCSDFPPGFCTIPRHWTALRKSAGPLSFAVNGHTQIGNLIKMSLEKTKQEQDRSFKVMPRWGWWDKCTQDYTNKCRKISLMAACTPLIYCIGAAHLVTSPAERGTCQAGTFFQRKLHQQHPL